METDAKQRGILTALVALGLLIFLLGGSLTGTLDFQQMFASSEAEERPEFDPDYLYARAFQLYEANDRALARDVARRLVHLKPAHKDGHKLLAAIAMRDRDYAAAIKECRRLIEIDNTDMTGYLGLGTALRSSGDHKEAEKVFRTVLSSEFSDEKQREEAHLNLAELALPKSEISERGAATR